MTNSPKVEEELSHRDAYAEERRARLDGLLLACLRSPRSREPLEVLTRYLCDTKDPAARVLRYAVGTVAWHDSAGWWGGFVLSVFRSGKNEELAADLANAENAGGRLWPYHAWPPFQRIQDRLTRLAREHGITTGRDVA